jgi:hypothetical protein
MKDHAVLTHSIFISPKGNQFAESEATRFV